jgi:hypothetical protein
LTDLALIGSPAVLDALEVSPDPLLSLNVYCAGRLSEVIQRAVAPFRERARELEESEGVYTWTMRYAKCGEHLKIRVHGPEGRRDALAGMLGETAQAYLSSLPPADPEAPRKSREFATPVDREDRASTDYPDRTWLWTAYERSHISLGYRPYLNDDGYVGRLTRCLGRGLEILSGRIETDAQGRWSHQAQQAILLRALIAGLSGLSFSPTQRSLYLLYHRDCLLRGILKQAGSTGGPKKLEETLDRFRVQVEKLGAGAAKLGETAHLQWDGAGDWERDLEAWRRSLSGLADYLSPICGDLAHHIDPFAEVPLFPPLFKAFHGFANQVGLSPLNEAFAYHLLLSVTTGDEIRDRPVRLKPQLDDSEGEIA